MLKKIVLYQTTIHSFESTGKLTSVATAKVTSVIALYGVTSFWRLKDLTNTCKRLQNSPAFGGIPESRKKLKTSNLFSSFIVSSNRNRSAMVRELLCISSPFVGQLYEDKSLVLCARDLIFFTTDLQTVNYYATIHR